MTKRIVREPGWVKPFAGIDLKGQRFGRLLVLSRVASGRNWQVKWLCKCDCGAERIVLATGLRSGRTQSCGCYRRDRIKEACCTHRLTGTAEHRVWVGMLARCSNPNVNDYKSYGGRGIAVCDMWRRDFLSFLRDVGHRPSSEHSIDRIDVNGNYEPGNVRWATRYEQGSNRRNTRYVVYKGERMSIGSAIRAAGSVVHVEAAWIRIKTGWTVERAVETPRLRESHASKTRRATKVSNRILAVA